MTNPMLLILALIGLSAVICLFWQFSVSLSIPYQDKVEHDMKMHEIYTHTLETELECEARGIPTPYYIKHHTKEDIERWCQCYRITNMSGIDWDNHMTAKRQYIEHVTKVLDNRLPMSRIVSPELISKEDKL